VGERRQLFPQAILARQVDFGYGNAFTVRDLGDHVPPGINHEGMTVRGAAGRVRPHLGRGDDVGQVLDGSGPQEDFPVSLPRLLRESRRHREHPRARRLGVGKRATTAGAEDESGQRQRERPSQSVSSQ